MNNYLYFKTQAKSYINFEGYPMFRMLRSILSSSRSVFAGVIFFAVVVAGMQLYSYLQSEAEFGGIQQQGQQLENNEMHTAAAEKLTPPNETTQNGHWHDSEDASINEPEVVASAISIIKPDTNSGICDYCKRQHHMHASWCVDPTYDPYGYTE